MYFEKKKALIIDEETDFCLLMCRYMSNKNANSFYALNISEGLKLIELEKPDIIIASKDRIGVIEASLHHIINTTDGYDPDVFLIDTNSSPSILG